nr:arginase family protein [Bacillota bacterium]
VPGGFKVNQVIDLIKKAVSMFEVTSIDLVEYNPLHDKGELTLDTMVMLVSILEKLLADRYSK